MTPSERIQKAINSCNRALGNLDTHTIDGKRRSVGDLNFAIDRIIAAKMILLSEIEEESK